MAILNLRGRKANSGWKVDHWRISSAHTSGSVTLVGRDAGELIGGDVADAVAAGLDRVHLHRGQLGQDVRHAFERRPVELDVLAGAEVAIAAVVLVARSPPACAAGATRAGRRGWQPAASARASGCRGRSAGAADGSCPRRVCRPGSARSGRGTAPPFRRPVAGRFHRRCTWRGRFSSAARAGRLNASHQSARAAFAHLPALRSPAGCSRPTGSRPRPPPWRR